ncbi:LmbU family transcriptional regulator [Micromonospora sp. DT4]|uniref:LmbU family transcriptional regulator n=1 Tax=Micromonospora sp. DT4 TaxID=3393438 RepID=UPI003CF105F5
MTVTDSRPAVVRSRRVATVRPGHAEPTVRSGEPDAVMVTRVGLSIPTDLSYDRWEQAGRRVADVASSSAWCLGDWINYGQSRYADRYRQAIDAVGLDYQTIRNYAWVARRFDISRRRAGLSFQHHAEVVALPTEEQDSWLTKAETFRWSRSELRARVRESRHGRGSSDKKVPLPRISAEAERVDRWRSAAERSDMALEAWILSCLDRQANEVLVTSPE